MIPNICHFIFGLKEQSSDFIFCYFLAVYSCFVINYPEKMIKLTDNALLRLRELRKKNDKRFVRLDVKGGGCAGFEYEWSYADEDRIDDVVIDDVLLVSRDYELYVMGLELDYSYDDFESMFKFNNPKAKSTCGCGTSFSVGM